MNRTWGTFVVGAGVFFTSSAVFAEDGVTAAMAFYPLDNIVLLFCAVLVLFMQAEFAALESGMSPLNNTVNIMFKNFTDRGASIRIPIYTVEHGWKGYLEDRRRASNADPYRVTSRILKTYAEAHQKAIA